MANLVKKQRFFDKKFKLQNPSRKLELLRILSILAGAWAIGTFVGCTSRVARSIS
jgi:hypothetical protein